MELALPTNKFQKHKPIICHLSLRRIRGNFLNCVLVQAACINHNQHHSHHSVTIEVSHVNIGLSFMNDFASPVFPRNGMAGGFAW